MIVTCKQCKRKYEIEEKNLAGIRPSSYLCPRCIDKDGKIGVGAVAGAGVLAIIVRGIIKFFTKGK